MYYIKYVFFLFLSVKQVERTMIVYESGLLGLRNLFRVHGSAIYKAIPPTIFSTSLLLVYHALHIDSENINQNSKHLIRHPYAVGALIAFFSFLLTFRLNFSYARYWESATAIHQMLSKWLDFAMNVAAFHYQAEQYKDFRPPSFGEYPNVKNVTGRNRDFSYTEEEALQTIQSLVQEESHKNSTTTGSAETDTRFRNLWRRNKKQQDNKKSKHQPKSINSTDITSEAQVQNRIPIPLRFQEQFTLGSPRRSSLRSRLTRQSRASLHLTETRQARTPAPSLFLQEAAHLVSLLSGVAMSTLRNDIDGTESPLVEYIPGKPWPPMDPDELSKDVKVQYGEDRAIWRMVYFILGLSRSERHRTLYNAARPFAVLGGVSDGEIELLQQARGPYAKMALVTMWLQEFLSRETLNGSTGDIAPPIISRLYQFISDGVVGYNQARKIAYVPFPYPHAQITSFFSLTIIFIFPILYFSYLNKLSLACILNAVSVLVFLGSHEVARELENPFQNVPNDIPLITFQAQFNEALVCMYAGYPPDSWWEVAAPPKEEEE